MGYRCHIATHYEVKYSCKTAPYARNSGFIRLSWF